MPDAPFDLMSIEPVTVECPKELLGQYLMSPFVWRLRDGSGLGVLLRGVPRAKPGEVTGRIWYGRCDASGSRFEVDDKPLHLPGTGILDAGGCEDPTVVPTDQDCMVYYTGVDPTGAAQMLCADGPDIRSLSKRGMALASSRAERNTKEASVDRTIAGRWRLLYEYARHGRSRIWSARGPGPHGPREERDDPSSTGTASKSYPVRTPRSSPRRPVARCA